MDSKCNLLIKKHNKYAGETKEKKEKIFSLLLKRKLYILLESCNFLVEVS
jgi:hypothetical protein